MLENYNFEILSKLDVLSGFSNEISQIYREDIFKKLTEKAKRESLEIIYKLSDSFKDFKELFLEDSFNQIQSKILSEKAICYCNLW